jgi:hypothetical protein
MAAGGFPLGTALRRAAGLEQNRPQPLVRLATQVIQPLVEAVQIGLLGADVGIASRVDGPVLRIGGRT